MRLIHLTVPMGIIAALAAQTSTQPGGLQPAITFSLNEVAGLHPGSRPVGSAITDSGLWFLVKVQGDPELFATLANVDATGNLVARHDIPQVRIPMGLAATSNGIAVVGVTRDREKRLLELDEAGTLLRELAVPCASQQVIALDGEPATICPDGKLTRVRQDGSPSVESSWARPGALTRALAGGELAIVDRATGQLVLNRPQTGALRTVELDSSAVAAARQRITDMVAEAKGGGAPSDLKRPVLVGGMAVDGPSILMVLAISKSGGPATVVKTDRDGRTIAEYSCNTPSDSRGFYIDIAAFDGSFALSSPFGEVALFHEPVSRAAQ